MDDPDASEAYAEPPYRILVADDHQLFRKGLVKILEEGGYRQVVEAAHGLEALTELERGEVQLCILDLCMPRLNGIDAAREIHRRYPRTRVMLLTMYAEEELILDALRAGIRAYVLKNEAMRDLLAAIREVREGRLYLSSSIARQVVDAYRERREPPAEPLTERERQVLKILAEGNTIRQAAARLSLSVKTVETHKAHIMNKLGLHGPAALVKYALRRKLIY